MKIKVATKATHNLPKAAGRAGQTTVLAMRGHKPVHQKVAGFFMCSPCGTPAIPHD